MLFQELRQGVRALLRAPSLTTISILTVALGVGAGTSLFSVVKAVLLNPLPYPDSARLTWVAEVNQKGRQTQVAYRNFLDWREQSHSFTSMTAFADFPVIVAGGDLPLSTHGALADESFFTTLGVSAQLGRTFAADEVKVGVAPVAVIGYGLWQSAFGGDPAVIGRRLRMSGVAATVIGVMPPGFAWPEKTEIWLPITATGDPGYASRTGHNWRAMGRLRPVSTVAQAQAEVGGIERRIKQQYPSPFQGKDAAVATLQEHMVGQVRPALLMLFGAVGFLLLIVCVNVANLLLVRVTARSRELAVRAAMGAGRRHLIRQMLTESLLLGAAGGVMGLLLASLSMELLRVLLPAELPRLDQIQIDGGVVAFALAIAAAAGLLFGLLPAWRASAMNVNDALKSGSRSATAGRASKRTQSALVVSEVCLSLVLVAGAALLARSFWNLRSIDPGFRSGHVLVADTSFPEGEMPAVIAHYRDLLARVRAIPGVEAAGTASVLPIAGFHPDGHFNLEGRPDESKSADADYAIVSPGYLSAMRIPLLRGRDFNDGDTENGRHVAVISQEMVREYFPGTDPIGQRIWFDSFNRKENWLTIVGVAGDTRQSSLTKSVDSLAYVLYTQQTYPEATRGRQPGSAHQDGRGQRRRRGAQRHPRGESGFRPDTAHHGIGCGGVSGAAAISDGHSGGLRAAGAGAGGGRALRSPFLYRDGEPDADRHPAGAGRAAFHRVPHDYRTRAGFVRGGCGAGSAGMCRAAARIGGNAIRHWSQRSGDHRGGRGCAAAGGSRGSVLPGASRHAHRPHDCPAGGVKANRHRRYLTISYRHAISGVISFSRAHLIGG